MTPVYLFPPCTRRPPGLVLVLRDEFHWDTFDHPPYSPELAPLDFHLFLKMKEHLAGKRHAEDEDLQHAVVDWLNSQTAVGYEEGISKLVRQVPQCPR